MAAQLSQSFSGLSLAASCRPLGSQPGCTRPLAGPRLRGSLSRTEVSRGSLVVVAAQNAKKRIRTADRNRTYNKAHRSAVATRMKKVLKALEGAKDIKAEEDLAPVQTLMNEAYEEIDKAIVKGILHKNTGARRKSRLALARQRLLIANGLYTPVSA